MAQLPGVTITGTHVNREETTGTPRSAARWSSWTSVRGAALAGCRGHLLIRLSADSVFYTDPITWPGRRGRPGQPQHAAHLRR